MVMNHIGMRATESAMVQCLKIREAGWQGGTSWGVGGGEESESNVMKILLLEVSISRALELPYVKAKKKCHWKETLLCGHLACKYICAHICAGVPA